MPVECSCKDQKRKVSEYNFWNQTRIVILVLSLACMTLTQINSQIYTFTVICMDDVIMDHRGAVNHTDVASEPHWIEKSSEKSIVFSATAVGGVVGLLPSVPLLQYFGVRKMFTICGAVSILGTVLFPLAVSSNFYAVCICRFLQGLGISILLTLVGVIPNSWAPHDESSTFLAVLSSAWQLSSIIFMPISGVLCDSELGWRSIYYIFGLSTFLAFVLFYWLYSDVPRLHKNVSEKELEKIESGKVVNAQLAVPYQKVCSDKSVLASWIGFFGANIGFVTLLLYGPTYLREVLHFDVRETGLINALPFILCAIYKFVAGSVSDKITFITNKTRFTIWMISGVIGVTIGFITMAFTSSRLVAQIAFTFAIIKSGLIIMGTIRSLQLRCREHTRFAVAINSMIAYLVQFLVPILIAVICPDNSSEQWSLLFIVISAIMIVANIPFPFLTSGDAASYTSEGTEQQKKMDLLE